MTPQYKEYKHYILPLVFMLMACTLMFLMQKDLEDRIPESVYKREVDIMNRRLNEAKAEIEQHDSTIVAQWKIIDSLKFEKQKIKTVYREKLIYVNTLSAAQLDSVIRAAITQ